MSEMAHTVGEKTDAVQYKALSFCAARFLEDELFNGDYFVQKIEYRGLRDQSFLVQLKQKKHDAETLRLLRREGPNYQYGAGCLSDGVIGSWMAEIYGVKAPLDRVKVRKNLLAIHRHNFRRSLVGHENTQRPGYAMEEDGGLLLCSWPRGGKPTLPFIYSDEVWTGIEYQVASHLASEGLLASWSGFRYSAVEKTLWFGPAAAKARRFQVFFSTASAYGTLALESGMVTVRVLEGSLAIDEIVLRRGGKNMQKKVQKVVRPAKPLRVNFSSR
jgi:hypothetical protein